VKTFLTIIFLLTSQAMAEQGTMSTDTTEASSAEASLSGESDYEVDLKDQDVQMQEDEPQAEELDEKSSEGDEYDL
jgi:hypothetical protein